MGTILRLFKEADGLCESCIELSEAVALAHCSIQGIFGIGDAGQRSSIRGQFPSLGGQLFACDAGLIVEAGDLVRSEIAFTGSSECVSSGRVGQQTGGLSFGICLKTLNFNHEFEEGAFAQQLLKSVPLFAALL